MFLICLVPDFLSASNVGAIRVSPLCRFTTHVISSLRKYESSICASARHQHMKLSDPSGADSIRDIVPPHPPIAQPVGWKSLLELCSYATTISGKCLGRCPYFQKSGARFPSVVVWSIVGRSVLMSYLQLMGVCGRESLGEQLSIETGGGRPIPNGLLSNPPPLTIHRLCLRNRISSYHPPAMVFLGGFLLRFGFVV